MSRRWCRFCMGIAVSLMITVPVFAGEQVVSDELTEESIAIQEDEAEALSDSDDGLIIEEEPADDESEVLEEPVSDEYEEYVVEKPEESIIEESEEPTSDEEGLNPEESVDYSGKAGSSITYSISGTTLRLSGTGATGSFDPALSNEIRNSITKIIVEGGITTISRAQFEYFQGVQEVSVASTVTTIGDYAFYYNTSLREVKLKEGLQKINYRAFKGCSSLSKINIPSTIGQFNIGDQAFEECSQLKTYGPIGGDYNITASNTYGHTRFPYVESVVVPKKTVNIPRGAFYDCAYLKKVVIESGVKTIGYESFSGCKILNSVTIPEGVTCIDQGAFQYCNALTKVTIPKTCTTIDNYAFYYDISLKEVKLNEGLQKINYRAFKGCSSLSKINIPSTVGQFNIGDQAFAECSKLKTYGPKGGNYNITASNTYGHTRFPYVTSVVIPKKTVNIPRGAFYECEYLTKVVIESGVKTIGYESFSGCKILNSVTIPEGVTYIDQGAFQYCNALTKVTIPKTCTTIDNYAFYYDISLKEVKLNEGLQKINYRAFKGCSSLSKINIPSTVGQFSIGDQAFAECSKLKTYGPKGGNYNITASNTYGHTRFPYVTSVVIPKKTVNIPRGAFYDCDYLKKVVIESGVKTIGYEAFTGCDILNSVKIPQTVTLIEQGAFEYCKSLEKIVIPKSVKTIERYAFGHDSSLKTVTLNEGLNFIGYRAFESCPSLKKINIPISVKTIDGYVFANGANGFTIYAGKNSVGANYAKNNSHKLKYICYIKYQTNGGTGTMNTQYVSYNGTGKLAKPAYTKKGYKFKGWCADQKGKGKIYKAGTSMKNMKKNITLYAIWKK